jgi:hypothetical protein
LKGFTSLKAEGDVVSKYKRTAKRGKELTWEMERRSKVPHHKMFL